ncbi:MlaD family protein [Patulibacter medicamentivorans]|uniref:MlaD family protein n=1 Tax=Patulibacter medicamentivorans TaxID=1097667 RepID=UPI000308ECF5|nr:MlaD family protein [Patulibacter medicamentivorans]
MSRRALSAPPRSPVLAGIVVIVLAAIAVVAIMLKDSLPGSTPQRLSAVVEDLASLKPGAPVRVAGVTVGKVVAVDGGPGRTSIVRMELDDPAPPVRRDAELKIRPRIFLEGNFLVDLHPGTPGQPAMPQDGTIPISGTTVAVQVDKVVGSFPTATRRRLQETIQGFGNGISSDATVLAMRSAISDSPTALRTGALLAEATRGERPGDLTGLVRSVAALSDALVPHVVQLRGAVRGLDRTMGAFAGERVALRAAVRQLPATLERSDGLTRAMAGALPGVRQIADELLPGVRATPATIDAARPWVASARVLAGRPALGGWVREMRAAVPDLIRFADDGVESLPGVDEIAKCVADVIVPAGNVEIRDGRFSLGVENFKGFWYGISGAAGESQNFTGSGNYSRVAIGLGPSLLQFGADGTLGQLAPGATDAAVGVRPVRPARRPPYRDDVRCSTQPVPDPNSAESVRGVE